MIVLFKKYIKSQMILNIIYFFLFIQLSVIAQKPEPSPVIVIMADQLRFDVLEKFTPNINALKNDGVNFKRAYCASPICAPSRASFFTGLYPNNHQSLLNAQTKDYTKFDKTKAQTPNLYTILENSHQSIHVGKNHFITAENIEKDPNSKTIWIMEAQYNAWMKTQNKPRVGGMFYRSNIPEIISPSVTKLKSYSNPNVGLYKEGVDFYFDHYVASQSVEAIKNREKTKPILLNAMFLAPHPPFHVPEPYFSMVKTSDFTLPENVGKWNEFQSPLQMYNITGFIGTRYTREQWREIWTKYLGLVKMLDDEVGRIIQTLKNEGLYENATIVFTSDHGEMLGSHSLWQKMCMYEESAKIPLIIKFPSKIKTKIKETETLVSLVDVLPTILDINQDKSKRNLDGKSLLPLVHGEQWNREAIFIQYDGNVSLGSTQRCIVKGDFKLIVDMFKDETFVELYDLKNDSEETKNLIFDTTYEAKANELIGELSSQMKKSNDRIVLPADLRGNFIRNYRKETSKDSKTE
jgi:arylsulfatase A-like enzyme